MKDLNISEIDATNFIQENTTLERVFKDLRTFVKDNPNNSTVRNALTQAVNESDRKYIDSQKKGIK